MPITLHTSSIAQSAIKTSLQKATRGISQNFKFCIDNLVLKISLKLSYCLGFADLDFQSNKLLDVHILHWTKYSIYHIYNISVYHEQIKGEDLCGKLFCD